MLSPKPRLLRAHQVPESYRELGILSGYRPPRSSASECLLSLFGMNNETLNIWTHLVPAGYFLWLLLARLRDLGADAGAGPFLAYLGTCALYPLASSAAHTFGAMGGRGRHRAYCCDYAALSLYSLGSALAYSAYAFPPEWLGSTFHGFYVPVAVFNSVLSTGLSCYSRWDPTAPGIWGGGFGSRVRPAGRLGRGNREFFPLGNAEESAMGMWDSGRSLGSGKFQRGFMESWDGLDWEGTWRRSRSAIPGFWRSCGIPRASQGIPCGIPGVPQYIPCGIPSVSQVEFPVLPSLSRVEFLESHVKFPVYPMWNSQCFPCGIPSVSQHIPNGILSVCHVEFPVLPILCHVEFLMYHSVESSVCHVEFPVLAILCRVEFLMYHSVEFLESHVEFPVFSRFLEAERPCLSKASRTLAFVYPYIFDSIPVFYRVSIPQNPGKFQLPQPGIIWENSSQLGV
uniref:Progestin and adipoQ receptor family member 5 n=1 Tax=Ficedula albicollis TaxID=59894 RepID=A0A803VPE3_FICAL